MVLKYVDIAKGIGIILVVLWHYGPSGAWPECWTAIASVVYKFHMPLFMFLAGYLLKWQMPPANQFLAAYRENMKRVGLRLFLPYCAISLLFAGIKCAGQPFFAYHPVTYESLVRTLLYGAGGVASVLWFIYVLMIVFAVFPLMQFLLRWDWLLLAASTAMAFVAAPPFLALDRLVRFFAMFVYGYIFRKYGLVEKPAPGEAAIVSAAVFVLAVLWRREEFITAPPLNALIGGLSGSLVCIFVAILFDRYARGNSLIAGGLTLFGRYSPIIYLLHQPFAWIVPVVLSAKIGVHGNALLIGVPFALVLGLGAPILIEKFIISRSVVLSLAILGGRNRMVRRPAALPADCAS